MHIQSSRPKESVRINKRIGKKGQRIIGLETCSPLSCDERGRPNQDEWETNATPLHKSAPNTSEKINSDALSSQFENIFEIVSLPTISFFLIGSKKYWQHKNERTRLEHDRMCCWTERAFLSDCRSKFRRHSPSRNMITLIQRDLDFMERTSPTSCKSRT